MRKTQKTAVVGTTVAVLFGAGIAYAAWTSTGLGSGDVTAGSAQNLSIAGADVSGLYPTKSVTQTLTFTNPNSYDVTITDLVQDGAVTVDSGHSGCNASSVSFAGLSGLSLVVPAGTNNVTKDVTVAMSNAANDACQGAEFTVSYKSTGASS
jgi:hypothetical protein